MNKLLIAVAAAALVSAPAFASEQSEVVATVHQFIDGFNKGDVTSALAACSAQTSIVDEFPPHEWHGPGACAVWAHDFDADAKKNGITDGVVTLGKPRHVDISGNNAYVVMPANFVYKKNGKPTREMGSTLTVALQKEADGWRMTGWAWSRH